MFVPTALLNVLFKLFKLLFGVIVVIVVGQLAGFACFDHVLCFYHLSQEASTLTLLVLAFNTLHSLRLDANSLTTIDDAVFGALTQLEQLCVAITRPACTQHTHAPNTHT